MGGLARRVSYIKAFKHRSNGEVPALFVDAGNLFTDDKFTNTELPADGLAKNRWVTKAYGDFRHDAANISYVDLPYMAELLKKEGYEERLQEYPFIKKMVSSNVRPADDRYQAPAPFVIREVTLKRGNPNQKIKVGIIGLTDAKPVNQNQKETQRAGFIIDDPFQAAKNTIAQLKPQVDFIIALAYMQQDDLQRLASENPEIDTIIGASGFSGTDDPVHFNRATITKAYNQTKYMGELRYYIRGDGSLENQLNRFVALDGFIPDDPTALEATTLAHDEFTNEANKNAKSSVQPTNILGGKDSPAVTPEKLLENPNQKR
jgi:2',3'-cyclic-nucleotide 2'-phosphodiesterase (5'-nucleotidase family)